MVELKKITLLSDNMKECIALDITPEKKDFVESNAYMLAWAYENNSHNKPMECRAIYVDDKMVGLIVYQYYTNEAYFNDETVYRLRPFAVDKHHLGNGYEEQALKLLIDEIRTKPLGEASAIYSSYDTKEEDMAVVYEHAGFAKIQLKLADEDETNDTIFVRLGM